MAAADVSSECIDVWVGGDGVDWYCSPSVLYRIPTETFDYYMMMGRLNNSEDLDTLLETLRSENKSYADDEYTDIWVARGGLWSGLPSVHYAIPADVFQHLQAVGDTERTIGGLTCPEDLEKLVERSRREMQTGVLEGREKIQYERTKPTNTEVKVCGHVCCASSVKEGCCACMDRRPIPPEGGGYPAYIDGQGWGEVSSRGAGYCPYCMY